MVRLISKNTFRSFLYGGASILLAFNVFFLFQALFTSNFVPIVLILAGTFTAAGLLLIVYAEQRAREQERQENRRISRVATQLESPLNSLQSDLTSLIGQAEKLPAEARLKLKHMETRTKVLLENIRDVFLMLQAQEGKLRQEARIYDLCVLLNDVIEEVSPQAKARNVELLHKFHCQNAPVKVDKRLLRIGLLHVLENALTYTLTPGMVNVVVIKGEKKIRVIVQDRGVGISESDAKVIWLPFARGSKAGQFDEDGIGVGLTLTKYIIRASGGDVSWRNREKGMGTEFEISLPLASKDG